MTAALTDRVTGQRWYGSKSRTVMGSRLIDSVELAQAEIELVELTYDAGAPDVYQLFSAEEKDVAPELVRAMRAGLTLDGSHGFARFHAARDVADPGPPRLISGEQSNSSVVLGNALILKVFRRLEPGVNPELEMLRFLGEHGFENVPALLGWYEYSGGPLAATLGLLQEFVRDGVDGWEFALDEPDRFLGRLARLGAVTAELHNTLASDHSDPAFAPEESNVDALAATIGEEITRLLPGRGEDVRALLRRLTDAGTASPAIRTHGDFHLGQTLVTDDDWVLLDFEGEPARPVAERRRKRSPLRDVAGMLRSFSYAAGAAELLREARVPDGWEERARQRFLDGYLATVEPNLLPPSETAIERLLAVFELEKAVYELQYELDNRPDWVPIPAAAIERLLAEAG